MRALGLLECLEDIFGQNDANATKMAKYTYMLYEISTLQGGLGAGST